MAVFWPSGVPGDCYGELPKAVQLQTEIYSAWVLWASTSLPAG